MILLIIRIFLATLFLTTGYEKLVDKEKHFAILKEYRILPKNYIRLLGTIEIYTELITGAMLLIGLFLKVFVLISITLFLIYSSAISINLIKGKKEISCGCGGIVGHHHLSWKLVIRNFIFIILAIILLNFYNYLGTIDFLIKGFAFKNIFPFKVFVTVFLFWGVICIVSFIKSTRGVEEKLITLIGGKDE